MLYSKLLKNNKISNTSNKNYTYFKIIFIVGAIFLFIISSLFLYIGSERISFIEIYDSIFHFNASNFSHIIIKDIRLPRLLADIIVGGSLAIAGAIMQCNTKNPMADTGIMGVNAGATFAIIFMMTFFPNLSRLERFGFSFLGALIATILIYSIAVMGRRGSTPERMILSGMAVSTLFSSITMAIILKNGAVIRMMKYMAGSSANTRWMDIKISIPFFLICVFLSLIIAKTLTLSNLGDEVSKGLGVNLFIGKLLSTLIVLFLSGISVIVIGPVGYVGLLIPYIVKLIVGLDYRYILPISCMYGAIFVTVVDLIARTIIRPREFPVGIIVAVVGVPFFIAVSTAKRKNNY